MTKTENLNTRIDRHYLSCDWGTTSFRLKLAHIEATQPVAEVSGSRGIKKMHEIWKSQRNRKNRLESYCAYLKQKISCLQQAAGLDLEGLPVVLSGMGSSSIGLRELPYSRLPLDLNHPVLKMEILERTSGFPHEIFLISGLQSSNDVMRGEETQLLGIVYQHQLEDGFCILPGTHSKHMTIQNSHLTQFKTYLTGELFDLLGSQSILKNSITSPPEDAPISETFEEGIQKSADQNLLHSLFQIRAGDLLYKTGQAANYDFLSGLLIGTELKDLKEDSAPILLAGEKRLQAYYSRALNFLQLNHLSVDPDEDLTLLGHHILMKEQD
ncbi:MAG: 2-dehydro-3-deoxygalactonokinase [Balneolaceae bacterium]